jgi:DNA-binding MarR family transcriptional regulator
MPETRTPCGLFGKIVNVVNDLAVDTTAVAARLRPILLRLNRELRRELAPLGVTGGQAALLHVIKKSPGVGVRELAVRENISAAAISTAISRLENAGLVLRIASESDRRRVGLYVTEAGHGVLRAVRSRRTAWLASRLRKLPPDDLAAVEAALEPLAALLDEGEA